MSSPKNTYSLADITTLITDGKHGDCKNKNDSGYYFLSVKDIKEERLNYEKARQIEKIDFDETDKRTNLQPGDILFTNTGTIGRMAIAPDNEFTRKTTFQKSVAIIKPNKEIVFPKYLFYLLKKETKRLCIFAEGTTQKNLLLKDLRSFHIGAIHKLDDQKTIAHILGTLDEKIELNKKNNETLEGIAKALFKSWFLDFDPVRAKVERRLTGLPDEISDLFPDSFEDSELGKIPKDWKKVSISQFVDIKSSKRVKMSEYKNQGVPFYRSKEIIQKASKQSINTEIFISNSQYESFRQKHGAPVEGDILLTSVGTLGIPYLVREIDGKFYFKDGNLTWFTNFSKNLDSKYLFYFLQSKEGKRRINEISIGSTQAALTIEGLKSVTITLPPLSIMKIFSEITNSFLQKISINLEQTSVFEKIRDSILPKLFSGEISIPDAEKMFEEVGI